MRLGRGPLFLDLTNKMLALASVVGREFDFALLAGSGGYDDASLLCAIDTAALAGLIVETPTVGRYGH